MPPSPDSPWSVCRTVESLFHKSFCLRRRRDPFIQPRSQPQPMMRCEPGVAWACCVIGKGPWVRATSYGWWVVGRRSRLLGTSKSVSVPVYESIFNSLGRGDETCACACNYDHHHVPAANIVHDPSNLSSTSLIHRHHQATVTTPSAHLFAKIPISSSH